MTTFVALAVVMVLVCLAIVLVPLWRGARQVGDRRREANVEIYRQRCAEIKRDVSAGRLSTEDAAREQDELGARLLADVDAESDAEQQLSQSGRRSRPWIASVLSVLLIAAGGSGAYYWLGDWQAINDRAMPNVDQLMTELQGHIAADPNDTSARLLLAQAQQERGQYAAAADNLAVVNQRRKRPDPQLLAAEAELRMAAGGDLSGKAGDLYAKVLQLQPDNATALWYLGLRASEAGNKKQAIAYWNRLLKQNLPDQARTMVESRRNALAGDVPAL